MAPFECAVRHISASGMASRADVVQLPIIKGTLYEDLFNDAANYLWRVAMLATRRPAGWVEQLRSTQLAIPAAIQSRPKFVSDIDLAGVAQGIIPRDKCTHAIWQLAESWIGQAFDEICRAPATSAVSASELAAIVVYASTAFVAEYGGHDAGYGGFIQLNSGHVDGRIKLLAFSFVDRLVWELSMADVEEDNPMQLQLPPVIV